MLFSVYLTNWRHLFYVKLLRTIVTVIPSGFSFSNFMYVSLFRSVLFNWNHSPKNQVTEFLPYKKKCLFWSMKWKSISLNYSWAVYLIGPYSKIYTAKGTNQKSSFHRGPFQPHNRAFWYEKVDRPTSFPGKALGTRL